VHLRAPEDAEAKQKAREMKAEALVIQGS